MGLGMVAHFDAYPASAHFVGDGGGGGGTQEAIQDKIVGVGGNMKDALD